MAIIFGKLVSEIFANKSYKIRGMRVHGGKRTTAIFDDIEPPPIRKTIEYQFTGKWVKHAKYGKQFHVQKWKRSEAVEAKRKKRRVGVMGNLSRNSVFASRNYSESKPRPTAECSEARAAIEAIDARKAEARRSSIALAKKAREKR